MDFWFHTALLRVVKTSFTHCLHLNVYVKTTKPPFFSNLKHAVTMETSLTTFKKCKVVDKIVGTP